MKNLTDETRKYIQDRLELFSKAIHDNEDTGLGYAIMVLAADITTDDMAKERQNEKRIIK